jgi:hypothetical protein
MIGLFSTIFKRTTEGGNLVVGALCKGVRQVRSPYRSFFTRGLVINERQEKNFQQTLRTTRRCSMFPLAPVSAAASASLTSRAPVRLALARKSAEARNLRRRNTGGGRWWKKIDGDSCTSTFLNTLVLSPHRGELNGPTLNRSRKRGAGRRARRRARKKKRNHRRQARTVHRHNTCSLVVITNVLHQAVVLARLVHFLRLRLSSLLALFERKEIVSD